MSADNSVPSQETETHDEPFAPRTYQSAWQDNEDGTAHLMTAEDWLVEEADVYDSIAHPEEEEDQEPDRGAIMRAIAAEIRQLRVERTQWANEVTRLTADSAVLDRPSGDGRMATDEEGWLWLIARQAMETGCGFAERSKEMGYELRSAHLDTMARDLAAEFMKRLAARRASSSIPNDEFGPYYDADGNYIDSEGTDHAR